MLLSLMMTTVVIYLIIKCSFHVWLHVVHTAYSPIHLVLCTLWLRTCMLLPTQTLSTISVTIFLAQKTRSRFQILHQSPLQFHVLDAVTFKDQLFLLCRPHHNFLFAIHVHDRNNMTQVKGVIPLPEIQPTTMVACSVSNCLYILNNKLIKTYRCYALQKTMNTSLLFLL